MIKDSKMNRLNLYSPFKTALKTAGSWTLHIVAMIIFVAIAAFITLFLGGAFNLPG
jgi:hypothetical protein